jgi:hypothetical protein
MNNDYIKFHIVHAGTTSNYLMIDDFLRSIELRVKKSKSPWPKRIKNMIFRETRVD